LIVHLMVVLFLVVPVLIPDLLMLLMPLFLAQTLSLLIPTGMVQAGLYVQVQGAAAREAALNAGRHQ